MLVTGADGFIGSELICRLNSDGRIETKAAVRNASNHLPKEIEQFPLGQFDRDTNWYTALRGVNVIIHAAGRAHLTRDLAKDPIREFRRTNVEATLNLARQAVIAGVRRFVFLSSVKVNGEGFLSIERPVTNSSLQHVAGSSSEFGIYKESDIPTPSDPYGVSKHEAEIGLRNLAEKTSMEVVIIRPPLVYGPRVRANFLLLMRAVSKGIPLPFGAVNNRRSLVGLDNLIDFILKCAEDEAAANHTFFVSDGQDLSTPELIRLLANAMNRPTRLIPVPASILLSVGSLLGKRDEVQRLVGSLQVDITKARQILNWVPPFSLGEGLKRAVSHVI